MHLFLVSLPLKKISFIKRSIDERFLILYHMSYYLYLEDWRSYLPQKLTEILGRLTKFSRDLSVDSGTVSPRKSNVRNHSRIRISCTLVIPNYDNDEDGGGDLNSVSIGTMFIHWNPNNDIVLLLFPFYE